MTADEARDLAESMAEDEESDRQASEQLEADAVMEAQETA